MERKVYKIVEKKGQVFGLPFIDLGLIVLYFVGFIIAIIVLKMFKVNVPKGMLIFNMISTIFLVSFLKYLNKKKHPSFLISFISFKFLQPKHLTLKEPKDGKTKQTRFGSRV